MLATRTPARHSWRGRDSLEPILRRIEAHILAAERLHGDDTTVPVLAKSKTNTGRCLVYVRDDRPFDRSGAMDLRGVPHLDHCCAAWNKLTDQPWRIKSIALRDWANGF